jgi:hypothetical protein
MLDELFIKITTRVFCQTTARVQASHELANRALG